MLEISPVYIALREMTRQNPRMTSRTEKSRGMSNERETGGRQRTEQMGPEAEKDQATVEYQGDRVITLSSFDRSPLLPSFLFNPTSYPP